MDVPKGFQTSLLLRVEQRLQKLPKFDINDLKLLFHSYILIPRKCPRKTPFKTQWGGALNVDKTPALVKKVLL